MSRLSSLLAAAALCSAAFPAHADDASFLASFAGNWSGAGQFRISTASPPVPVTCAFDATTSATRLTLDGKCRGMVVVSRRIGVTLNTEANGVSGSYVGSTTGPAGLAGGRSGDAFDLAIRWAKTVNGDRDARMKVEKTGAGGMRLTTTDVDPKTGRSVVTGKIELTRL
ncbi:hypothetical protein [Mesorhizobium marinum]|uniref:DUF1579 domain-containing protein n=1 Tax=Mesorhizobium marinum TaxID=3228790 RepID=A0ABV3R566_9HYPH